MADIQIAIIDQEDTQITLAVPGVQGPVGNAIPSGGTTNQVLFKSSATNYDAGWTFIGNANVDAAAAIAGTKISPNFGSQATVTTGTNTAASFIPTSATIPSNGIYLPGANQVGVATNGVERLKFGTTATEVVFNDTGVDYDFRIEGDTSANLFFVDASTDRVGIGTGSPAYKLDVVVESNKGIGAFAPASSTGITDFSAGGVGWTFTRPSNGVYTHSMYSYDTAAGAKNNFVIQSRNDVVFINGGGPTTSTETMRIVEGKVAIGSTSPGGTLDIKAAASTHPLIVQGPSSEFARVDSSGRLLVGTIASPAHQLQVSTDSAGKPSTNTWTIVSDERIKEDIELADLDLCYEAVKTIPLKRFKWKDEVYTEEQVKDRRKLGWIAQDVEAVFPKAVGTYEFKYNQVFEETIIPAVEEVLDDEGNVTTPAQPERIEKGELISEDVIEDCRDLNSDQLYAAMYGAIQKLMVKVETLETELAALKAS